MSARKWTCPSCTYENDSDQNPTRCDVCKHKRYSNSSKAKPNMSAMRRAAVKEQPYRLVPSQKDNQVTTLWGINVMTHIKFLLLVLYGYLSLFMVLPIWVTFFPHISVMKVLYYLTCAVMTYLVLQIILFVKRQYEKQFDPIPWTKLPFFLPIILTVFAASHGVQWQYIMENASKIADNRFWIESLKVAVVELEYGMQAMDERITKQIDELNATYTQELEERASLQKVEELASNMWKGFGLPGMVTRSFFGLGCFAEGTQIQIDEFGNMVNVETLNRTDSVVFNHALNMTAKVMLFTVGPEDEDVFEIVTVNGRTVTVTKSHPMRVCAVGMNCEWIRADEVKLADTVMTIYGLEKVVDIVRRPGSGMMVYNVMMALDQDVSLVDRTIVANGMITGDLLVQSTLE